jgi:cytoskeletal protein CcmA (bactofilin family)
MKKQIVILSILALLMMVMTPAAFAQEERSGTIVTIAHDEVIDDDLYVTADSVLIDGTITGDLITFSSQTTINGTVEGDVLAIGQYLTVNGEVGGSVRAVNMITTLNPTAHLGKDLFVSGYGLNTEAGSVVEGDVRFFGGQGTLNGDVGGNVIVSGGGVTINGSVDGDVTTNVGAETNAPPMDFMQFIPGAPAMPPMTGGVQFGDGAEVAGDINITAPETANLDAVRARFPNANVETTAVTQAEPENPWIHLITRLVSLLLVGALVAWFKPDSVAELSGFIQSKPLPSLGWGALVYFLFPIFMLLLGGAFLLLGGFFGLLSLDLIRNGIFLVGLMAAVVIMVVFVLILTFVTKIAAGYLVGRWIFNKTKPALNEKVIWPVLLGLVIVAVLISLPYLGSLLNLLIAVFGLGAAIVMWRTPKYPVEKEAAA